jgi:transposase
LGSRLDPDSGRFAFWCFEPDKEPDLDRLAHPNLSPPRLGSTKSNLLHSPRSFGVEAPFGGLEMEMLHRCCAGLDVHKKTVVACIRRITDAGRLEERVLSFGTTTGELLALADWLAGHGVRQVAMESTGVYWKPVYNLLEPHFEVMLVNAQHIKKVPGRKTDVSDSQWIAELLQFGLLRPSFIPPLPIRQLRDLTRQRTQLVRHRATACNRIQKVLEDANIKLASVAADILGVSGRAMLKALINEVEEPAELAERARGRMRSKIPARREALRGQVRDHHRFQLQELLDQVTDLEGRIARLSSRVATLIAPYSAAVERLQTIPGVDRRAAEVLVAEVGTDMTRFATADHLCSWAGMSPGNDRSAGKRRSGRTTKGNCWLRSVVVQAAWAASHTKTTILGATYRRWVKRMGRKRALVALGHKILVLVYKLLSTETAYEERLKPEEAA